MKIKRQAFTATFILCAAFVFPVQVASEETITYTYDALGRLVVSKSSGSVNDEKTRSICYDSAGNRIVYDANSTGIPAACVTQG